MAYTRDGQLFLARGTHWKKWSMREKISFLWVYLFSLLKENGLLVVHFLKTSILKGFYHPKKCSRATLKCLVGSM